MRWMKSPLVVVFALVVAMPCVAAGSRVQPAVAASLVCRSLSPGPVRTWTFTRDADTWRVTHAVEGESGDVTLTLPNARMTLSSTEVTFASKTANGGIDVRLRGPLARATLDAYVNYELEVNVDASLTPDIDEIATDAPTGVACVPAQ